MLVLQDTCQQQLTNKIIQQQNIHKIICFYVVGGIMISSGEIMKI